MGMRRLAVYFLLFLLAGCASTGDNYIDKNMDFGAIRTVAVMPFQNLTNEDQAAERVRDTFIGMLMSTEAVYVIPTGEVARGISRAGVRSPSTPSTEEVARLKDIVKVDAIITGSLKEYGVVRSGTTSANVVSASVQMIETQTGKVVWTASSTKGGISIWDRLFGGGGEPMNDITEVVVRDLINKLLQ